MKSKLQVWLAWRHLILGKQVLTFPAILSIAGMAIGVATLILAMAVFSGFEKTLQSAIRDVTGDLVLIKSGAPMKPDDKGLARVEKLVPDIFASTKFIQLEGLVASHGQVSGAVLQGVDPATVGLVTNLNARIKKGTMQFAEGATQAVIGQGMARKLHLDIGSQVKFILPVASKAHTLGFSPKVLTLDVVGIIDLGKYDFDERFVITDLQTAQTFAGFGTGFTGYRMRLNNGAAAQDAQILMNQNLGYPYWTRSWQQLNQNLLQAAALEKIVIFFVVAIMLIAASFNVAGHLYVSILKKFADISILRTMGASGTFISSMFAFHGLIVGLLGGALGLILGLFGGRGLQWLLESYELLPADVYKISSLKVDIRPMEVVLILIASSVICYLASLIPARRGGRLSIIEGIRHE